MIKRNDLNNIYRTIIFKAVNFLEQAISNHVKQDPNFSRLEKQMSYKIANIKFEQLQECLF